MVIRIVYAAFFAAIVYPALLIVQFGIVATGRIYATALVAFAIMLTGIELARVIGQARARRVCRNDPDRRHEGGCHFSRDYKGRWRCAVHRWPR